MKPPTQFKAITITVLAFIFGSAANAQITITESDMPVAGNAYYTVYDSTATAVTPGGSGPGQTWDLSAIANQYVDTEYCLTAASTPYAALFPTANLVLNIHQPFSVLYQYYNLSSGSMATSGSIVVPGATTETFTDSPAMRSMTFPLTYLSTWGGTSRSVFKLASAGTGFDSMKIISWVTYTDTVDAWGTVITPAGSWNSLRLKQLSIAAEDSFFQYSTDSNAWAFIDAEATTGLPTGNYSWYANSEGIAVASIGYNVSHASYLQTATSGIKNISLYNQVNVYPNPGNGKMTIKLVGSGYNAVGLYDMLGRQVYAQNVNAMQSDLLLEINESNLPGGVYLLQIDNKSGNINKRVVIEQ